MIFRLMAEFDDSVLLSKCCVFTVNDDQSNAYLFLKGIYLFIKNTHLKKNNH